ncbi:hypothetical protein EYF80_017330 [Liparis tanakae]|uniref:Uncharacterized protein n=1 Tax=Liparis tanakae TaxID=230148 RepID=A0A4Z2I528_9TELE|nr:hypothetical protein EYF80_017330 [Liparis tanakae]
MKTDRSTPPCRMRVRVRSTQGRRTSAFSTSTTEGTTRQSISPFCKAQADSVLRPFTTEASGSSLRNTPDWSRRWPRERPKSPVPKIHSSSGSGAAAVPRGCINTLSGFIISDSLSTTHHVGGQRHAPRGLSGLSCSSELPADGTRRM